MTSYAGRTVVFGTRHDKQRDVAGPFAAILGAHVVAPHDIDTDQYGTFSGEVARVGSAIDAARAKAHLAIHLTGHQLALASEASYGPRPDGPIVVHEELLLFRDEQLDIEILEGERTPATLPAGVRVTSAADASHFLARADFGQQAVIVRPSAPSAPAHVEKAITDIDVLAEAIRQAAASSQDGRALVEPDLRACYNPTRRAVLRRLGERLARRLATPCPTCGCPGYGRVSSETGLPCRDCATPTELIAADEHRCAHCPHQLRVPRPESVADPQWCSDCNP